MGVFKIEIQALKRANGFILRAARSPPWIGRTQKRLQAEEQGLNPRRFSIPFGYLIFLLLAAPSNIWGEQTTRSPELSRPVRSWEFLSAVGQQAGLFGDESGRLEAWIYPLKIVRDFQLRFRVGGHVLPGSAFARTVTVRPESSTILYVGDTFTVRETLFVPIHEQGAIILLDVSTTEPLEVEATFVRDFQLGWPGAIGGSYVNWNPALHAFTFNEDLDRFSALLGSPAATDAILDYQSNFVQTRECSFGLGVTSGGRQTKAIILAASTNGHAEAEKTYRHLSSVYPQLLQEASQYYAEYLGKTVRVELPDDSLQQAFDWSRIGLSQGIVTGQKLGTGLIAGYRGSGESLRPGFAWFFGRDALWTSLALNAERDFATSRMTFDFLIKYQRADGKIPHEVSQSAGFVPWFRDYPYGFASADATPLLLIAIGDYVSQSGDAGYAREKWEQIWKAYQFLASTFDRGGFAQNRDVGHGWVEGGPLLPVDAEFYQSALGVEALRALAHLAQAVGKPDVEKDLMERFARQKALLNQTFWSEKNRSFVFGVNGGKDQVDFLSTLSTVPMWFQLVDEDKAESTINQLAGPNFESDWGMRLISSHDPNYAASGYHFGSVWPLFTGWASVGEYRYHRSTAGYSNLRANAMLALDGSLGHVTEVLSGDVYQPLASSSPQQIWSSAMVISPVVRGMLGLEVDGQNKEILLSPHVPAEWNSFAIGNVVVNGQGLDFSYSRGAQEISLTINAGPQNSGYSVVFAPEISLRAHVTAAELDGRPVQFHAASNSEDQHVSVRCALQSGKHTIHVRFRDDFGLGITGSMPGLGQESRGLRIVSMGWTPAHDALTVQLAGIAGETYDLNVRNAEQIQSIAGASLTKADQGTEKIRVVFPAAGKSDRAYENGTVIIRFKDARKRSGTDEK